MQQEEKAPALLFPSKRSKEPAPIPSPKLAAKLEQLKQAAGEGKAAVTLVRNLFVNVRSAIRVSQDSGRQVPSRDLGMEMAASLMDGSQVADEFGLEMLVEDVRPCWASRQRKTLSSSGTWNQLSHKPSSALDHAQKHGCMLTVCLH